MTFSHTNRHTEPELLAWSLLLFYNKWLVSFIGKHKVGHPQSLWSSPGRKPRSVPGRQYIQHHGAIEVPAFSCAIPTSYLPVPLQEGHICESSGNPSIPYSCTNHSMEKKEHFLDWDSPDTFPNWTSEQNFCSGELYPIKESRERKTVLRRLWSVRAWALLQFTAVFPDFSEMWACPDFRALLCRQVTLCCKYSVWALGLHEGESPLLMFHTQRWGLLFPQFDPHSPARLLASPCPGLPEASHQCGPRQQVGSRFDAGCQGFWGNLWGALGGGSLPIPPGCLGWHRKHE